jgi:hypothetical protein
MIKKILQLLLFFSVLYVIPTYGQTVSISNLRYTNGALIPNGSAIEIYEGGSKSVTFDLKIDNPQALSIKGYLYVKSKKSSSASSSLEYVNVDFNNNKLSTWYSKEFTISLNASNFNATGGSLYGQFSVTSSGGGIIIGNIIPVKVISAPITNNLIAGNQIINEGQSVNIIGSNPSGGLGNYSFEWQKREANGTWVNIGGATSSNLSSDIPLITTSYRRIVKSSSLNSFSNELTITVNPAPPIQNNTITMSGSELQGSLPSGGVGTYIYYWYAYVLEGEDPWLIGQSINCSIPISVYNFVDAMGYNGYINRVIVSGKQQSISNSVIIPPSQTSLYITVYPNPTSGMINFSTNFLTDKEIEIIFYSDKLGSEKSVFKGIITPNQLINWSIPSNYPKGLYFYKILSDNKEVKSGKILYQ